MVGIKYVQGYSRNRAAKIVYWEPGFREQPGPQKNPVKNIKRMSPVLRLQSPQGAAATLLLGIPCYLYDPHHYYSDRGSIIQTGL